MLIFTKNKRITLAYSYLIIKDKLNKVLSCQVKYTSYYGVKFFVLNEKYKIIEHDDMYYCSCGKMVCWHVFGVIFGDIVWEEDGEKYI